MAKKKQPNKNLTENKFFTHFHNYFEVGKDITSRYDKIFMGNNIKMLTFEVFDTPVSDDMYHFLSDHRAISSVFMIQNQS